MCDYIMCDYFDQMAEDLMVNELNELKNSRDNVDLYVHNALVKCIDNQGFVYIGKIETVNENDILVKVGYSYNVKDIVNQNIKLLNAFFSDNLSQFKEEVCQVFEKNVPSYNKYGNDVYMISRYDLKEFVKNY